MSRRHTVIFNKSFAWSTLSNYFLYTDSEIIEKLGLSTVCRREQICSNKSKAYYRTRQKQVDYLKLNDGLDETPEEVKSPKPKI